MERVTALVSNVSEHSALKNKFFKNWVARQYSVEKIAIFARNYYEFTRKFPKNLALLISNTDNLKIQVEYSKTLYSECGYGEPQHAHSLLFENFCHDLSKNMGHGDFLSPRLLQQTVTLLDETKNFIEGQKQLYLSESSIAVGAQLALEWQAYGMLSQLYEGARQYKGYWPTDESFHTSCEFFYIHIGAAEKDHQLESLHATYELISSNGKYHELESGFLAHLELITQFWNGIANQMNMQ
jgi:pyrroloquinoline quinone (PQQ) biosynthesis protein C